MDMKIPVLGNGVANFFTSVAYFNFLREFRVNYGRRVPNLKLLVDAADAWRTLKISEKNLFAEDNYIRAWCNTSEPGLQEESSAGYNFPRNYGGWDCYLLGDGQPMDACGPKPKRSSCKKKKPACRPKKKACKPKKPACKPKKPKCKRKKKNPCAKKDPCKPKKKKKSSCY